MTRDEPSVSDGDIRPSAHEQVHAVELDDDLVVMDEGSGRIHVLNPTAGVVWRLCDGSATLDEIADLIAEVAEGADRDQVRADIEKIVDDFASAGLLEGTRDDEAVSQDATETDDGSEPSVGSGVYPVRPDT